jgi:hypothetical protein
LFPGGQLKRKKKLWSGAAALVVSSICSQSLWWQNPF